MTTVSHLRSNAMARTDVSTTPAATSRADTSLTGFGKENNDRITPSSLVGFPASRPGPPLVGGRHRLGRRGPDVAGGRADQAVVRRLLEHVGAPPDGSPGGEGRGEHLAWDATGMHHHAGVELDV